MKRGVLPGIAAIALGTLPALGAGDAPPLAGRTYLVLPFENVVEDATLDWLSSGLALSIGEALRGFGGRPIEDEERSVFLEGSGVPPGATLSLGTALDLGRRARSRPGGTSPDRLVLGRFTVQDGGLQLQARTVELETSKASPWVARDGRLRDLLDVQEDLAVGLLEAEGVRASGRSESLRRQRGGLPLLAFETYCRAMAETDTRKRLQLLRRAVQEFPGYPKAAYQGALLLAREERWGEAAVLLGKAAFDPHPYEADFHLLAASVALERREGERAAEEARRALAFEESARGHLLLARALVLLGDREQARAALDRARVIDPSEPEIAELLKSLENGAAPRRAQ